MPSSEKSVIAASSEERPLLQALDAAFQRNVSPQVATEGNSLVLPESVLVALRQVVHLLAQGESIQVVSANTLLTTQEAATLLQVSRPFLIKLLTEGSIPFMMVGSHRRIMTTDLLRYKALRDGQRKASLQELVQLTEELGLYKDEKPYSPDES